MGFNNMGTFESHPDNAPDHGVSDQDYDANDGLDKLRERIYDMTGYVHSGGDVGRVGRPEGDFHPMVNKIHSRLDVIEAAVVDGDNLVVDRIRELWADDEGLGELLVLINQGQAKCREINSALLIYITLVKHRDENKLGIYGPQQ